MRKPAFKPGDRVGALTIEGVTDERRGRAVVYACRSRCGRPVEVSTASLNNHPDHAGCETCAAAARWAARRATAAARRATVIKLFGAGETMSAIAARVGICKQLVASILSEVLTAKEARHVVATWDADALRAAVLAQSDTAVRQIALAALRRAAAEE